MSYAAITDSSNPFATSGLSREVRAILDYVSAARAATGWDIVVTSTTDHPKYSASGNISRHRQQGTEGEGLAVDLRMRTRGTSPDLHDRAFNIFIPVEARCHELIYAYPPVGRRADGSTGPYNIRGGRRVAPYAVSDHRDHCHISVNRGVFLRYPGAVPSTTPVPAGTVFVDGPVILEEAMRNYIAVPPTNPLDSKGDGWYDLPFRYEDVLAVSTLPPQPEGDADIVVAAVAWRDHGGRPRVAVDKGDAGAQYGFRVLSAGPPVSVPGWSVTNG